MTTSKRIVCLANSRKLSGRCIAGRELHRERAGDWVRPVSDRVGQEVSEYERQYEDGSDPRVLDVIDVPVIRPAPDRWQSENWLLDDEWYWGKVSRYSWLDLPALVDPEAPLWLNGFSTSNGSNDQIPVATMTGVTSSLRLIELDGMALKVFAPGEAFGNRKRRVQGCFRHASQYYSLWVTDPVCERHYLAKLNGDYRIGHCFLTISLGEEFRGYCYKLIAAVIEGA